MKIKSFLIMVLSLISLTVAAQNGGIKGKVVSRATRTAIDGVKVTLTPATSQRQLTKKVTSYLRI